MSSLTLLTMRAVTILSTIILFFSHTVLSDKLCEDSHEWNDICHGYPRIFKKFARKIDGKIRKCWIQDLTEEYFDEVVKYYMEDYMFREPLGKYCGCNTEPGCADALAKAIKRDLQNKLSLIALTTDDAGNKIILGYSIHGPAIKGKGLPSSNFTGIQKMFDIVTYVVSKIDIFEKFNIESYLDSMGVNVPVKYGNNGIGKEILAMRYTIAKCNGFKLATALCTDEISQIIAPKVGFKQLIEMDYDELKGTSMELPGIKNDSAVVKLMYLQIK